MIRHDLTQRISWQSDESLELRTNNDFDSFEKNNFDCVSRAHLTLLWDDRVIPESQFRPRQIFFYSTKTYVLNGFLHISLAYQLNCHSFILSK
jgi:hypothetical protein